MDLQKIITLELSSLKIMSEISQVFKVLVLSVWVFDKYRNRQIN